MKVKIEPKKLGGYISAIGSKSDAHRALICAALSDKPTLIESAPGSEDINVTSRCLISLGAKIEGAKVYPIKMPPDSAMIDCHESGSTLRFMLPLAAALTQKSELTGAGGLARRPNGPLLKQMSVHGVKVSGETLPLKLEGRLGSGRYMLPGNVSSQYISGLLMALPILDGDSFIELTTELESASYIEMTLQTMSRFGVSVKASSKGWEIKGNQSYISPGRYTVEGDWSNAAFFLAAGVKVTGLNPDSAQPDKAFVTAVKALDTEGKARIDVSQFPDLFPILSVVACMRQGRTVLYGAGRLRLKESDRIMSTAALINNLGGRAKPDGNSLIINGQGSLRGGDVDSFNDHRIAMAAAIAATICESSVIITGAEAVNKSYPGFWTDYMQAGGIANVI